jgi:hypothetical protein
VNIQTYESLMQSAQRRHRSAINKGLWKEASEAIADMQRIRQRYEAERLGGGGSDG